jgi:hypothetical protein
MDARVIGKCDTRVPHLEEGMMSGAGYGIAYPAPVDLLNISQGKPS